MLASMRILKRERKEKFPYDKSISRAPADRTIRSSHAGHKAHNTWPNTDEIDDKEWTELEDEIWSVINSGEYEEWAGVDKNLMPVDDSRKGQFTLLASILSEVWDSEGAATVRSHLSEIRNDIHTMGELGDYTSKRRIGDELTTKHEIKVRFHEGNDAWHYLEASVHGVPQALNHRGNQIVPVSWSDKSKEEWKPLYDYCEKKLAPIQVKRALKDSVLGPGKVVTVMSLLQVDDDLPDGVAKKVLELIKTGNNFGKVKMDKYGSSVGSEDRIKYEVEREEEYPEAPNVNEDRWRNEPSKEDKKKYGWKKILESTNPGVTDTKDWMVLSVDYGENQDIDTNEYPSKSSPYGNQSRTLIIEEANKEGFQMRANEAPRQQRIVKNLVFVYHGDAALMVVGTIVKFNLGSKKQQQKVNPLIDHSALNWRKW